MLSKQMFVGNKYAAKIFDILKIYYKIIYKYF